MNDSKIIDISNIRDTKNSTTKRSDYVVLRLSARYSPSSIRNIHKAVLVSLIICFFLLAVALLNRKYFYDATSLVYTMPGLSYSIITNSAAVLILGAVFGWGLSFLNYQILVNKSRSIALSFIISITAFFFIRNLLTRFGFYSLIYCVVVLSVPLFAVVLFAFRSFNVVGIIISAATLIMCSEYCLYNLRFAGHLAYLAFFLLSAVPLFVIAIAKNYFSGSRIRNFAIFALSLVMGFALLAIFQNYTVPDFSEDAQEQRVFFLDPQSQAYDHSSEAFSAALVRKLNVKASLIGPAQISKEEFVALIDWKYDTPNLLKEYGELEHKPGVFYEMEDAKTDPEHLSIEFLVPKKYDESYLLSYSAWKIGVIPTVLLALALLAVPIYLLVSSLKRKNQLAFLVSVGCSITLLSQTLLYILGNLGYSFYLIPVLPFLSTNIPALGANFAMVGLIVACHRNN